MDEKSRKVGLIREWRKRFALICRNAGNSDLTFVEMQTGYVVVQAGKSLQCIQSGAKKRTQAEKCYTFHKLVFGHV